jgi:hypothetical protein
MKLSNPRHTRAETRRGIAFATLTILAVTSLPGCGGGGGASSGTGVTGREDVKPDGSPFFVDPNHAGTDHAPRLVEMFWGRLVDVHDLAPDGSIDPRPVFRELVINENIQSDGVDYLLETNPVTQSTRLIVLREHGAPSTGRSFAELVRRAATGFAPVLPRGLASPPPFSQVVRNATLVLRFDDCLDDSRAALLGMLGDSPTIAVLAGPEGARRPFEPRLSFDPNHGALVAGEFHSTRVLVDMTTSVTEARDLPVPRPANSVGLPPGDPVRRTADLVLRIPTRPDPAGGQFEVFRGLSGAPLDDRDAYVDPRSPTRDVVRAMRIGHQEDPNAGYLLDLDPPQVLSSWSVSIDRVQERPSGRPGFDFLVDLTFLTVCRAAPRPGDVVSTGELFLEVVDNASEPSVSGRVTGVVMRNLLEAPVSAPDAQGLGLLASTFRPATPIPTGCWVSFEPPPAVLPATGLSPASTAIVRFSEPMSRTSMSPFDSLRIVQGDSNVAIHARNLTPADVTTTTDLRTFKLSPRLPLTHEAGREDAYHLLVEGVTDLAGNALQDALPAIDFTLAAGEPAVSSGATVMRFGSLDELEPLGSPDFRGPFFIDVRRELLRPRPVVLTSHAADRDKPVPGLMRQYNLPVQNPLNPLGSKLQVVWRYCDLGWQVEDETKYDLDVYGLSWAPFGGRVQDDYFERFEIALAHSNFLPDEDVNSARLPKYVNSGLRGRGSRFSDNILNHPLAPQTVVHPRDLGYRIRSVDLFTTRSGTRLMPFPLNRDPSVPPRTMLWRDTAVPARSAPSGAGIPLDVEEGGPLNLAERAGAVAPSGDVPTIGLPLLMEFRCFPTSTALGQNGFDVSLAINSSAFPAFRAYSGGGTNSTGQAVQKDPDVEVEPTGGFDPNMGGAPTPRAHDNTFYVGQLDVVTRISRAHSAWIDTRSQGPDFIAPQVLPLPADQPAGTAIVLEYRGANGFVLDNVQPDLDESAFPFDAERLDPYGEIEWVDRDRVHHRLGSPGFPGTIDFVGPGPDWSASIDEIDGARFVQLRVTFVGNLESQTTPELSGIGLAWSE